MVLGVTTQGPSLRPCTPGIRFVSNPMLRRAAASSPYFHRQLSSGESGSRRHESSGESHSGGHHKNSSKLSAKSLVDPRTRKWSVSSKHHLLSRRARDTSNSRESFAANGYPQADGLQRRPIPGSYRGHSAYATDDDFSRHRIPNFSESMDDVNMVPQMRSSNLGRGESSPNRNKVLCSQRPNFTESIDDMNMVPQMRSSNLGRRESSPNSNNVLWSQRPNFSESIDDMNMVSQMRSSNWGRRESSPNSNQVSWSQRPNFSEIIDDMNMVPQMKSSNLGRRESSSNSNKVLRSQRPNFSESIDDMNMVSQVRSSNLGRRESSPNNNEVSCSRRYDKPGDCSRLQNYNKYSTPQKEASHRQEYYAKGNHVTPSHTRLEYKELDFQHRLEKKYGVGSENRIAPAHLENFDPRGQYMYNGENLQTSRIQTHLTQGRRPLARFPAQGFNSYEESAQKNVVGMKDKEDWRNETKKIEAMRGHAQASIGSGRTDCQPMLSDINPASRTKEVSSVGNQGRDNMSMPTSSALDGGAPMEKPDHASVEESVPVEGSIATKTRGKQVGLSNLSVINSAQYQELQHPENQNLSSSRQVPYLGKVDRPLGSAIRTIHISNETDTGGVCADKSVQWHPEKTPLDQEDEKGMPLSVENEGCCSTDQEKEETPVTKGKLNGPNNGQDSASIEVGTDVMDSKSNNVPEELQHLYKKICIVKNVETAKMVAGKLMGEYKNLIHACDTEVAYIDLKKESPVGHGKIICFSIYCGPQADFGNGKSCVWVDVLDGGEDVLSVFTPYFGDSSIQKVWHNYSFDKHIIENHGINVDGFHADTMHLARLWNSARSREGGYSLEALTKDPKVMDGAGAENEDELIKGKESMKSIFGKKKIKKDGTEGKVITLASVEVLQKTERVKWICYSALDSISTLSLWKSLKAKLENRVWVSEGVRKGNMYEFYTNYWRPFGELLVQMESEGMRVDRNYLSEMEKVAIREQEISGSRFRKWASIRCPDACHMNVRSDAQVRQLLFGGMANKKNPIENLPMERTFKVPNVDNVIEEGKKTPLKFRNIVLCGLGAPVEVEATTPSGWPAVSGAALKTLAGKVSVDYDSLLDDNDNALPANLDEGPVLTSDGVKDGEKSVASEEEIDSSIYGTAYDAFGGGQSGREACHAITALCEVSSINTLISNFLQPLQGKEISGQKGRVHCSLNINTETGRLSARKPNLQNQPALEKDRYKIRRAFIAESGNSLIVADYGQLELRILAHLSNCKSMLDAFKAGGDFHSRTAMNMYPHVREAVEKGEVLLEWDPQPGEDKPPIPLLKDIFATERRKAKMLNFSIAYGKTAIGLSKDWKVSEMEAKKTVKLWYSERQEVLKWQEERKNEARTRQCVHTLLGRARHFPNMQSANSSLKGHIERAAINTPVQGSAADVAMCAMLQISRNSRLKELGWRLLLQVHDEVILEGPTKYAEEAKSLVVECMSLPFDGKNMLSVDLAVDAKCALNWYEGK